MMWSVKEGPLGHSFKGSKYMVLQTIKAKLSGGMVKIKRKVMVLRYGFIPPVEIHFLLPILVNLILFYCRSCCFFFSFKLLTSVVC